MPLTAQSEDLSGTRLALIEAGFRLFGRDGFAGASTRVIAGAAATNVASIAYHFGGKDGLRNACAAEFARRLGRVVAQVPQAEAATPQAARAQLAAILRGMAMWMLGGDEAGSMVPFVLRELAEAGPTLDVIYGQVFEPTHRRLCRLWGTATGQEAESEAVRLTVFAMLGQVIYFRIGAVLVARRMEWAQIGAAEASRIADVLVANLDAMLTLGETI